MHTVHLCARGKHRIVLEQHPLGVVEVIADGTVQTGAHPGAAPALTCRLCGATDLRSFLDLGATPPCELFLTAAALGFLGLGPPPPTPEWGRTIAESREFLPDAWWYAAAPGLAIFLTVMGFNLLGDGLRDVLDPRLRRRRAGRDG